MHENTRGDSGYRRGENTHFERDMPEVATRLQRSHVAYNSGYRWRDTGRTKGRARQKNSKCLAVFKESRIGNLL